MPRRLLFGKKFLEEVEEAKAFWLKIAHEKILTKVRDLGSLVKELAKAPAEAVAFHLREGKNDFANWIEDVVGDRVLAIRLRALKARNWREMQRKIVETIKKRIDEIKF
jgi:hypothetical protein